MILALNTCCLNIPKHSLNTSLAGKNVEIIEHLNTDQPTFRAHRGDSTTRIRIDGEEAIVHLEVQSGNSLKPMWARFAAYSGFLIGEFQKLSIALYCIWVAPQVRTTLDTMLTRQQSSVT